MRELFLENEIIGKLYIEQVFLYTSYPIIFTCRNTSHELYLCVCCRSNCDGKKWLLSQIDENIILSMLEDKITIRDAFLNYDKKRFSVYSGNPYHVIADDEEDWNPDKSISLPDAGEYMDVDEGEFDEEIEFYKNIINEKSKRSYTEYQKISISDSNIHDAINKVCKQMSDIVIDKIEESIDNYITSMQDGESLQINFTFDISLTEGDYKSDSSLDYIEDKKKFIAA